jgi:hypothetical protein
MAICNTCGRDVEPGAEHAECQPFGTPVAAVEVRGSDSAFAGLLDRLGGKHVVVPVVTYAAGVVALALAGRFGGLLVFLLVFPLVAGIVVVLARPGMAPQWVRRFEQWIEARTAAAAGKEGKVARYGVRPCLAGFGRIRTWTDRIADENTRCAVRAAGYLYFAELSALLAYAAVAAVVIAVAFLVGLILVLLFLNLLLKMTSSGGAFDKGFSMFRGSSSKPRLAGTSVVREGLLFDSSTSIKVNEQGQVVREGILFDSPTGVKLNEQGQIVREGVLFDSPSGLKVNEQGQFVKEGILFDTPSGYKVNEKGELVNEGVLLDTPTGIKFKKKEGGDSSAPPRRA